MTELVTVWHGALWRDDRPVVAPQKAAKWERLPGGTAQPRRQTLTAEEWSAKNRRAAEARWRNWPRLSHPSDSRLCRTCGVRRVDWKGQCRRCRLGIEA